MSTRTVRNIFVVFLVGFVSSSADAQYPEWKRSGSIYIITTPEGADLPASAVEENFPLLVRLNSDFFDFTQAKPNGEDVRFSSNGQPLSYQIETWDADATSPGDAAGNVRTTINGSIGINNGSASIWVRVPTIRGAERQEIRMHWGKPDAVSESNGSAVFNESNGHLSVFHMDDPTKDEVGALEPQDVDTTSTEGMIGRARRLAGKQGVFCGDEIDSFPTGSDASSSEIWFRPEMPNGRVLGWGNEEGQGKVTMFFNAPPHIRMDCYFSDANVEGDERIPMNQWVHVVHTYEKGEARIYVNGVLDVASISSGSTLNIRRPARMWIGGWYNNYDFIGDIDEVRISNVARSADWIRLQYENQKPLQTLVGPLVQEGNEFSVSQSSLEIQEGDSAEITANAGGAQKTFWILKQDDKEEIVAVDRLSLPYDAGRVTGDKNVVLQFQAVYADAVKTQDVAITIREAIPDPVFSFRVPETWNGRTPLEITTRIDNREEMAALGVSSLNYDWDVSGLAVSKTIDSGSLLLTRAQNSGELKATLHIDNGGTPSTQSATILVTEPMEDAWVHRLPEADEKPEDNQFYARDDTNEGTIHYNGILAESVDTVYLKVFAEGELYTQKEQTPGADGSYALSAQIESGLIQYSVEFGSITDGQETMIRTVNNLICGDAYIIQGQSNAEAFDMGRAVNPYTSEWIRSFGAPKSDPEGARKRQWGEAVSFDRDGWDLQIGYWGIELAKQLVEEHQVPIFIINGAKGGTRVDQHQRNNEDPTDVETIYGRLLWRIREARLTHGIRGVLWHQGENDQAAAGPAGGWGWETYESYFIDLAAAWKLDYPNIQNYYIFQIWPRACSMGSEGSDNMLREVQRTLPDQFSNMSIMSTLGIQPGGGCHYPAEGYAEIAHLIYPLVARDNYGAVYRELLTPMRPDQGMRRGMPAQSLTAASASKSITPPNLIRAYFTDARRDEIILEFDQPVEWKNSLASEFYLDGEGDKVAAGFAFDNMLMLTLTESSTAQTISYLDSRSWSQDNLLRGENGIAALTFCNVPLGEQ